MDGIDLALVKGNYVEAARLVQTLDPEDPWTDVYHAKIQEGQQQWQEAEITYRELLRRDRGPKITLAARQGLDRIQRQRTQQRKQAIAAAMVSPEKTEAGVLVLGAVEAAAKTAAAQSMAKIMNLDAYSARLILPSRGLRLYRSGALGELEFYGQQLKAQGIPAFWFPLSKIQSVKVYTVCCFETISNRAQIKALKSGGSDPEITLEFAWSDIAQRVEGQLPIFEEVVERDSRGKLKRKEQTQDYAHFCDLHLPKQNCILRLSDTTYQFNQGVPLIESMNGSALDASTAWANWRQLMQIVERQLIHKAVGSDFSPFAETALEHPEVLEKIPAQLNLFRREDSNWDPAFQLYSVLLFLHQAGM